jgi:hypothetical protein
MLSIFQIWDGLDFLSKGLAQVKSRFIIEPGYTQ